MTQCSDVEQVLGQHVARLQVCLQHVSGDSSGPEEGSDAWLLLNALIDHNHYQDSTLPSRFEQSGRWLAEQGGRLDARLNGCNATSMRWSANSKLSSMTSRTIL